MVKLYLYEKQVEGKSFYSMERKNEQVLTPAGRVAVGFI